MPYCSVEEAWGKNFYSNKTEPKKFKKIIPEMGHSLEKDYYMTDYPETDIYNKDAKSIYKKKCKKKIKKRRTFSRTYNRLPEHSGPKTRLPRSNKRLSIKNSEKILQESKNQPNPYNMDLPINNYDSLLEQEMIDSETDNESDYISDNESIENNTYTREPFKSKEDYINYLVNENRELKKLVNNIKNVTNDNDNLLI